MQNTVVFDPSVPWQVLIILVVMAGIILAFAVWRRLTGWWLRAGAVLTILMVLANPSYKVEQREPINDVVLLLVDRTASQGVADRAKQTDEALANIQASISSRPNTDLKIIELGDAPDDRGTLLMTEITTALAEIPENQVAGIFVISDGQIHDADNLAQHPAPLHFLQTGHAGDWDRRLVVTNSPGFGILGEPLSLTMRIEDQGAVPQDLPPFAELSVALDGGPMSIFSVPLGTDFTLPMTLKHGGKNVIQLQVVVEDTELTDRNNGAVIQINGVRDRLSVLLVSGEPYPGERTWRNLLKSDSSVDLVHFTILRPPQKQDTASVSELALIAFPTRELFLEKINDFDLIIFDRYRRRGILPSLYLDNVRQYVEDGGAVLIAAGPGFATAESLYRSPLGAIMPAEPTSRLIEVGYRPSVSDLGERHPVTAGLSQADKDEDGNATWGRWLRVVELQKRSGTTILTGPEDKPLLVLDRVGEGRIALLASDHAWLWGRGFEGGGPQQDLLRRLAHWMMKEPELEEESLTAEVDGQSMQITRRSLGEDVGNVDIVGPDGSTVTLEMEELEPGRFTAVHDAPEIGLFRLEQGDQLAVVAVGPAAPREFEQTVSTDEYIKDAVDQTRGGVSRIENGIPDVRTVRAGRVAAGRGWIGITPRGTYVTTDVRLTALLPAWLALILAAMFSVSAWFREGRR